jgi:hypothetical protein
MTIAFRAALAGNSAGAASLTQTVTLPTGWAAGDFCMISGEQPTASAPVFTTPSGWTHLDDGENGGLTFAYCFYYRVLQAGDTNPVLTSSLSAVWEWNSIAVYSATGGTLSFDAKATVVDVTTLANAITPNAAVATQNGDASLITVTGRASAVAADITSITNTPPSGWTNGSSDLYQQGISTTVQRMSASMYQLGLSSGSVTPGSDSFTTSAAQTFRFTAEHVLVMEAAAVFAGPAYTVSMGSS